MSGSIGALTSGRLIARNVGLNLVGWTLPALAALVAVPLLVRGLGDARFGVLTLAWTTIGYFSLFDLGIGRALTHAVSDRLGGERHDEVGPVVWTSMGLVVPVGILGAFALLFAAPWLAERMLRIPAELREETVTAFRVLAIAVPATAAAAALRGVLEATQRFGIINALRVPYGLLTFLGPLAVLPFTHSLVAAVTVLAAGRVVLVVAYAVACLRTVPNLKSAGFHAPLIGPLLRYGGWMTVSNIISPLMNTFDRFAIGAALSVSLVTYYAAPHELVTKMWLYTAALWPVFFPALAAAGARSADHTAFMFDRAMRLTFAGLSLPAFLFVILGREILALWLGPAFAAQSTAVIQILAVAILINSMGQGAYTLIQALGRPDLTGKFHMAELPAYAALLWFMLARFGIVGVAVAWAVRAIADALLLMLACPVLLPSTRQPVRRALRWLAVAVPVIAMSALVPVPAARWWIAAAAVPVWAGLVWWRILTDAERRAPGLLLSAVMPRA